MRKVKVEGVNYEVEDKQKIVGLIYSTENDFGFIYKEDQNESKK